MWSVRAQRADYVWERSLFRSPCGQEKGGIQLSVSSHFAAGVALPPGRYMRDCNHRSRLLQIWWTSRFSHDCGGLSSGGVVDTSVATCSFSCGGVCSSVLSTLRGTTCGSPVWPLLAHSTKWGQRYDACSSMFCSFCGRSQNFEISPTLSLLLTSSAKPQLAPLFFCIWNLR